MLFFMRESYDSVIKNNGGRKMNQLMTGKFISQKRKEKNKTQKQLAEKTRSIE